jgi:hypothetical protein
MGGETGYHTAPDTGRLAERSVAHSLAGWCSGAFFTVLP